MDRLCSILAHHAFQFLYKRGLFNGKDQGVYLAMFIERRDGRPFRLLLVNTTHGVGPWVTTPAMLARTMPAMLMRALIRSGGGIIFLLFCKKPP